jgi:hypothetical protein
MNAIQSLPGRAKPSEAGALKAWLRSRAIVMKMDELLPKSWYTPPQRPKKP